MEKDKDKCFRLYIAIENNNIKKKRGIKSRQSPYKQEDVYIMFKVKEIKEENSSVVMKSQSI